MILDWEDFPPQKPGRYLVHQEANHNTFVLELVERKSGTGELGYFRDGMFRLLAEEDLRDTWWEGPIRLPHRRYPGCIGPGRMEICEEIRALFHKMLEQEKQKAEE